MVVVVLIMLGIPTAYALKGAHTMASVIDINEYRATERANARMMDTTIWQACAILGVDVNTCRTSEVFHKLFLLYLDEERANN